jgi:hypothetical protein
MYDIELSFLNQFYFIKSPLLMYRLYLIFFYYDGDHTSRKKVAKKCRGRVLLNDKGVNTEVVGRMTRGFL